MDTDLDLHRQLEEIVEGAPPLLDPGRVLHLAKRRALRRRTAAWGGGCAAIAALGVGGLSLSGHGPLAQPAASAPDACRPTTPLDPLNESGLHPSVTVGAPRNPSKAVICVYQGSNTRHPQTLIWGATLDHEQATSLVTVVDKVVPIEGKDDVSNCPNDHLTDALVTFSYPTSPNFLLKVTMTGCAVTDSASGTTFLREDITNAILGYRK